MPWMTGAAIVGGSLLGGMMQSGAAKDAASIQGRATDTATAEQRREFDVARRDMAPYRDAGSAAVGKLRDLLGIGGSSAPSGWASRYGVGSAPMGSTGDPSRDRAYALLNRDFINSRGYAMDDTEIGRPDIEQQIGAIVRGGHTELTPEEQAQMDAQPTDGPLTKKFTVADFWEDPVTKLGLQFGLDEGTKGINRAAAARGMLNSGGTLKELTRYGTDYTGTKAAESENRFKNWQDRMFNMFSGVAGTGQVATTNTSGLGAQTATNIGNLETAGANARGAAAISGANAWANGMNTIGNWWNSQNIANTISNRGTPKASSTFDPYAVS